MHCKSLCSATEEWTICSLLEGCVQQAASHGHQLPRLTSGTLPGVAADQSTAVTVLTGGQVVTPPCLACSKGAGGMVDLFTDSAAPTAGQGAACAGQLGQAED